MMKGKKPHDHLTGCRNAFENSQDPFVRTTITLILFLYTRVGKVL